MRLLLLWKKLLVAEVCYCCYYYGKSDLLAKCEIVVVVMDEVSCWRRVRLLLLWIKWLVAEVCYCVVIMEKCLVAEV